MGLLQRVFLAGLVAVAVTPSFASRVHRGPTSSKHKLSKSKKVQVAAHPRAIDDSRASEIQGALVRAGYLQEVTGHWDNQSQIAMQKLQSDNGWQTKLIPDSRALIKLGLGPGAKNTNSSVSGFAPTDDRTGN